MPRVSRLPRSLSEAGSRLTPQQRDHRNATLQAIILGPLALCAFLAIAVWYLLPVFVLIICLLKGN